MWAMRLRDRALVTLSDAMGRQHPRFIYYRRPEIVGDTINDGALAAGRIVKFWLWFIAPFAAAFTLSVLWAIGVAILGA